MVSSRLATYRDLQEFYSLRDLYDMLEVRVVDAHNRYLASKPER